MGHAALITTIQEIDQSTPARVDFSFFTVPIAAAESFLTGSTTDARLYQSLSQVEKDLKTFLEFADNCEFVISADLREVTQDSLSLLADFREGPLSREFVALFLADARHFHQEFVSLGVASVCHSLKKKATADKLQSDSFEPNLTGGLYESVTEALKKMTCKDALCSHLESHYDEVEKQLKSFQVVAGADDWTSVDSLGEQLVVRGLTLWLEGLELLQESVLFAKEALRSKGLARLLDGHRSLLLAQ